MALNLSHTSINKINTKNQYSVFGFIRESVGFNIPPLPQHIVLIYYNTMDSWNNQLVGEDIVIKDNVIYNIETVDMNNDSPDQVVSVNSAYLTNIVQCGVHKWKFQLKTVMENANCMLEIGIIDYSDNYNLETD
eukprot:863503_1